MIAGNSKLINNPSYQGSNQNKEENAKGNKPNSIIPSSFLP